MGDNSHEKDALAEKQPQGDVEKSPPDEPEKEEERDTWGGKLDFIMSALSFAVGMGNLWRFPYLCYRNGGGAFLIPYLIMMLLAGFPMMFLEMSFGQYGRLGVVSIWKACPIFQGAGWAMFFVSLFTCGYYNMLNAWCIFYIGAAFRKDVPWRDCGNWWNTKDCGNMYLTPDQKNCTSMNGTYYNSTCYTEETSGETLYSQMVNLTKEARKNLKSPSDEYFHHYMLGISSGIEEMGTVRWGLALCYLFVWVIVFVCLFKGIQSSGKATYVTALFPYVVLLILFGRGVTLDGAKEGILFYLTPKWEQLASAKVWGDAAVQVFFSLSLCWGGLVTLASYNKFNNNVLRDSVVVAIGDCLTSIFAGIVLFSFIGYMSRQMGVPVDEVATQGAGLAFIVYPQAVTTLPISPLWAVLFMLMLINVGIGTQFTLVTTVHTTLVDEFPKIFKKTKWRPTILLLTICVVSFLIGLSFCTNGGMYFLQLVDTYSATYSLLIIGITLCVCMGWVYGANRFMDNIECMMGWRQSYYWVLCWKFVTPAILLFVLIFTFVDFSRTKYADVTLPVWADVMGWMITLTEVGCIPALAIYHILQTDSSLPLIQRIKLACKPTSDWGVHDNKVNPGEENELKEPLSSHKDKQESNDVKV